MLDDLISEWRVFQTAAYFCLAYLCLLACQVIVIVRRRFKSVVVSDQNVHSQYQTQSSRPAYSDQVWGKILVMRFKWSPSSHVFRSWTDKHQWKLLNMYTKIWIHVWGVWTAHLIECRTHGRKVASSNPDRSGGKIFFSRIIFVCWLLFGVRSTPVLPQLHVKGPVVLPKVRVGGYITPKHAYTLDPAMSERADHAVQA